MNSEKQALKTSDISFYIRKAERIYEYETIKAMEAQLDDTVDWIFVKKLGKLWPIEADDWPDRREHWLFVEREALDEELDRRILMCEWL